MLDKIKIKNFQAIKDVTIELGRITILVGSSDVGKSACIRALNSFFSNDFKQEFAHHGQMPFGIAIQKGNSVCFAKRGPKGVEYRLDNITYTKTAKQCPKDITDFLGIHAYQVDSDDDIFFQIQKQFDRPFLLTESSSFIAKVIGRISNLNVILVSMKDLYSEQLETKQNINFLLSKKKDIMSQQQSYHALEEYEQLYSSAEHIAMQIDDLRSRIDSLQTSISSISSIAVKTSNLSSEKKSIEGYLQQVSSLISKVETAHSISSIITSYRSLKEPSTDFKNLLEDAIYTCSSLMDNISINTQLSSCITKLHSLKQSSISSSDIDALIAKFACVDKYEKLLNIARLSDSLVPLVYSYNTNNETYLKDKEDFDKEYKELVESNYICPLSGLRMNPDCKRHLFS